MKQHYYAPGYFPGFTSRAGHWSWLDEHHVDLVDGSGGGTYSAVAYTYVKGASINFNEGLVGAFVNIGQTDDFQSTYSVTTLVVFDYDYGISCGAVYEVANNVVMYSTANLKYENTYQSTVVDSAIGKEYSRIIGHSSTTLDNTVVSEASISGGRMLQFTGWGGFYLGSRTGGNFLQGDSNSFRWFTDMIFNSQAGVWEPLIWGGSCVISV